MGPPEAEKAASSPDEAAFQKVEQISLPLNQTNRTDAHHSAPKKKATASGETSHTAASPAPARAVAKTEKKEKSS